MTSTNSPVQAVAVPYGWEEGQLLLGIVTAHRSRNWTLPKASVPARANGGEAASNEALRQGGFLGLPDDSPLLLAETRDGVELQYYAVEISGILDTWDANRYQSRKLVPLTKIGNYLTDRTELSAIEALVEQRLDVKLRKTPKLAEE